MTIKFLQETARSAAGRAGALRSGNQKEVLYNENLELVFTVNNAGAYVNEFQALNGTSFVSGVARSGAARSGKKIQKYKDAEWLYSVNDTFAKEIELLFNVYSILYAETELTFNIFEAKQKDIELTFDIYGFNDSDGHFKDDIELTFNILETTSHEPIELLFEVYNPLDLPVTEWIFDIKDTFASENIELLYSVNSTLVKDVELTYEIFQTLFNDNEEWIFEILNGKILTTNNEKGNLSNEGWF